MSRRRTLDDRRVVHISTELAKILREWMGFRTRAGWSAAEDAAVFPSTRTGGQIDVSAINRIWNAAMSAARVHRHPGTGPHTARHTRASRMYAATKDLRLVQDELGHANPSTTAIYAHVCTEAKLAAADAADSMETPESA